MQTFVQNFAIVNKSLVKAPELLKCEDLLIITWDYENEIEANSKTIKCLPLWK
jgi:hypothetical protein